MEFNYTDVKSALKTYFQKELKYKVYKSKVNDKVIYFYNKFNHIKVIKLVDDSSTSLENNELDYIIKQVSDNSSKTKVMKITISESASSNVEEIGDEILVTADAKTIYDELEPYFDSIAKLSISKVSDGLKREQESSLADSDKNDEQLNYFQKFMTDIKTNKVTISWGLLLLFVILPTIFSVIGAMSPELRLFPESSKLVFGGTTYSLSILGGQWWRIFTWGFAPITTNLLMSILFLFIVGVALFRTSKIAENKLKPLKFGISFLLSYVLLGLFASSVLPGVIMSGPLPILGILIGMTAMSSSGEKTPVARWAKYKMIWPMVIIVFITLFTGQWMDLTLVLSGLILGSAFVGLTKVNLKEWNWTYSILILIILAFVVVIMVFLIMDHYIPAQDMNVVVALKYYANNNLFGGVDGANAILEKIGWIGRISPDGNWMPDGVHQEALNSFLKFKIRG
ncbi:hypothetical protein [Mesoplasma photuris]|uniref:hypothetical protein n=1 Tax=Mesoplasma photuris TaxID=217731 RepID=UPI0004E1A620|nr:hypothetical protein [Mesoplasma photuris]